MVHTVQEKIGEKEEERKVVDEEQEGLMPIPEAAEEHKEMVMGDNNSMGEGVGMVGAEEEGDEHEAF